MESTPSSEHGRQSRGLARFWPVHGMPAPGQRQSDEDGDSVADKPGAEETEAAEEQTRTGDTPSALTSDTQMVALGSRRGPEVLNGGRPWNGNEGGFPPAEPDRGFRNGDNAPRHGGAPVPNGQPESRSPFMPPGSAAGELPSPFGPGSPFAPGGTEPRSPFAAGEPSSPFAAGAGESPTPFAPASPFAPHVAARGSAAAAPAPDAAGGSAGTATQPENGPAHAAGASRPTSGGGPGSGPGGSSGRGEESRVGIPLGGRRDDSTPTKPDDSDRRAPDAHGRGGASQGGPGRGDTVQGPQGTPAQTGPAQGGADGRAEVPLPRPAAGWASVPTSGVPTVTHTPTPPASGSASVAGVGSVTPVAGTPIIGAPDAPSGGRRSRPDDDELRPPSPRRLTTLDDFEDPRPRVGRPAAADPDEATDSGAETPAGTESAGEELASGETRGDKPAGRAADATDPAADKPRTGATDPAADKPRTGATDEAADKPRSGATDEAADKLQTGATDEAKASPKRPGDVVQSQIAFWDPEAVSHFRSQWHEVKADFVDDPVAALTRAHDLLTDAVNELTESLLAERDELDPLQDTTNPDTESMRMAMRGYREFLDRILAV
jgi:hypothetical protein